MGADFRADAVLQRSHNLAAGGVVLGVGAEHKHDIERKSNRVALNLYVSLLHDVEQTHLDFSCQIGKFVDREYSAIGAGKQAIVDGQFAAELVPTLGGLDGIDVSNQIGDGDVGRRQLLHIALLG